MACYRDSVTFYLYLYLGGVIKIILIDIERITGHNYIKMAIGFAISLVKSLLLSLITLFGDLKVLTAAN
jgi:hypothetical protein